MVGEDSNSVLNCEIKIAPTKKLYNRLLSRNKENHYDVQDWVKIGKYKTVLIHPEIYNVKVKLVLRAYLGIVKAPKDDPHETTRTYLKVTICGMEIYDENTDPLLTCQIKGIPNTVFDFGNASLEYIVPGLEEAVGEEETPIAVMEVEPNSYLHRELNIKIKFEYSFNEF